MSQDLCFLSERVINERTSRVVYQDDILHKSYITFRKSSCPNGYTESIRQDEMNLTLFDSDMTSTKDTSSDES